MTPTSLSVVTLVVLLSASLLPSALSATYHFTSDLSVRHPTSGLRYAAANFASPQLLEWGVEASRVGGDDQTPYNWKTDTSNADNDFFWLRGAPFHPFQQQPPPNQSFVDLMLVNTVNANSTLFLLVPTAGWVDAGHIDVGCGSFPIVDYGHQQSEYQQWGNGVYPNGTQLRGDWRCYVPFELPDVLEWLQHVRDVVGGDTFDQHVVLQLDNEYLMPWFLQQLERYYQATGVQLIDVLDNHYYPNLPADSSTPANRAEYFGEVRSWWDPTYTDPSWIGQCGEKCGGPSVMVLPRFHAWMRQYAPSLHIELAISEFAFGFDDSDETAAAATAESIAVLGLFNATWGLRWVSPAPGTAAEQVWALWHSWDGQGSSLYGDFALTHSSRADNVTAYTIYNTDASQLYVLLFSHLETDINCQQSDNSALLVQHATTTSTSAVTYQLVPGAWNVTVGTKLSINGSGAGADSSITVGGAACGMPARSIRLIVVRGVSLSDGAIQQLYVPWEDERYAAVDWNQPLVAVEPYEFEVVAARQAEGLAAVRAGKSDMKRRYFQSTEQQMQKTREEVTME